MRFLRALAFICFSFGLFVQIAAQAAVPQSEPAEMAECAEMAQASAEHGMGSQDESDREGPCPDMTLDCLVAMNCLPPLALSGGGSMQAAPFPAAASYLTRDAVRLVSEPMRPESPPPQTSLTV
ncbi:hypothetical protein [Sphingosinithalassobacter sp. LHW66-3]|uniref:hypothetical protein n=1 Tax=Sphingosinithalassobacter sp. LHW66-3 TaxID=3424718 RepID=UPI003D6B5E91